MKKWSTAVFRNIKGLQFYSTENLWVGIKIYVNQVCFTISGNRDIREWQFSLLFVILSENLANFCIISRQIVKITGIGREQDFTI